MISKNSYKKNLCPICDTEVRFWRNKCVERVDYKIDRCLKCGYAFVNPRPSLGFLTEFYSSFEQGYNNVDEVPTFKSVLRDEASVPNSTIDAERMLTTIQSLVKNKQNNRFLDVGCGYGFSSKEALNAGFKVVAVELAENERKIAKEMNGLKSEACSFEKFECAPKFFQVVFMSQILEHALDVNLWIKKASGFLVKDGIIAIALPNYGSIFRMIMQENDPFISPPEHLNFFTPNSLSRLLEKHGFKVEKVQWISRIPKKNIEKCCPKLVKPVLPIINAVSKISLKTIDVFHRGMMINVYGRKINA